MFLIMGLSPGEKKIDFEQTIICDLCGQYGRLEVYLNYMAFSLFFIPIIQWNKRYIIKTTCCNGTCEIDGTLGQEIAKGRVNKLDPKDLPFTKGGDNRHKSKQCEFCGYITDQDFRFCPKCGKRL